VTKFLAAQESRVSAAADGFIPITGDTRTRLIYSRAVPRRYLFGVYANFIVLPLCTAGRRRLLARRNSADEARAC